MKTCQLNGNMSSDRAGEQYPTETVCDECVKKDAENANFKDEDGNPQCDSSILSCGEFDSSYGDECNLCGKTKEEEELE